MKGERCGSTSGTNVRPGRRWSMTGATCGLVGIALVLLLSPIAQAASVGGTHIAIRAPFVGATGYSSSSSSSSGCGVGKIPHAPSFDATTGKVAYALRAHSASCSSGFGDSGSASAGETVTVPISVVSGNDVIHAMWTVNASVGSRIGAASCQLTNASYSYCYAESYAELSGYAYLYDVTNDSYWYSNNDWAGAATSSSFYAYCYGGNCSTSLTGSQHVSLATNVVWTFRPHGLDATHSYELVMSWYADVSAYDYSYLGALSGANESATVTMAGPGYGATLDSITIR
jgi:hypothetical protein